MLGLALSFLVVTKGRGASMQRWLGGGSIAAALLGMPVATGNAQPASLLPAPYQVESVRQAVDGDDSRQPLGGPRVTIDLGSATGRPWPARSQPTRMTLLGTEGAMTASLEDVIKVCETLCGDENEECHYEGILVPNGPLATIGAPVAALAGEYLLSDVASIRETAASDGDLPPFSSAFVPAIWPADNPADLRHRFVRDGDVFTLEYAWGSAGEQVVPLRACQFFDRGPVTRMACGGVEALLADGEPILVSFPDYNAAGADLVSAFVHDTRQYYVVRLALKVQTVYGLLFHDRGGWRARFHPRDYSLLC